MSKNLEQRIEELEKKVNALVEEKSVKLSKKLGVGDTFGMAGVTWKILDITEDGYKCLAEPSDSNMKFDSDSNDWKSSDLREFLNGKFYDRLVDAIGADNIIPFERNLLSLDGQTEYGTCEDKVSLLNVDEYRQYRSLIPNTNDDWWWLISPFSTPCNGYERSVTVVSPAGDVSSNGCDGNDGVRPLCIFSSAIFESEE